ncbi:MAG: Acyl-CoA thioester hydrolase YbgC [Alphaproteobacteria bacterium ADurb.Bin438]|nr:MAG: Acyl-CoA thioester hydrolase YbgC [Alphaproteobacteria bacterium ADurb.Bin438]
MENPFIIKLRIYYQDTDAEGIIYHSKYLDFGERARTEYLISKGYRQTEMMKKYNMGFVVKNLNITYNKTAGLEDEIVIKTYVEEIKNASFNFKHLFEKDGENLATIDVKVACVDLSSKRPVRIPEDFKKELEKDK